MESESRLKNMRNSISDKLQDQVWFQQTKAKWDELDQKTRVTIKYATMGTSVLLLLLLLFSSISSVQTKKQELEEKLALVHKIQNSQDELRKLKEITSGASAGDPSQTWSAYFESQAMQAGMDPATLKVSDEKVVAATPSKDSKSEKPKESLMDVAIKKINLRQLVNFVYNLENGARPAKVRNLTVETQPDESGYLDVTVAVSAFTFKGDH